MPGKPPGMAVPLVGGVVGVVCANPTAPVNKIPVAIARAMRRFMYKILKFGKFNRE
jgi:hypothetical protein